MHTHIEPLSGTVRASRPGAARDRDGARRDRGGRARGHRRAAGGGRASATRAAGRVALVTITLPGDQPLPSAHRHAGRIEEAVRERCPELSDVIVHTEPAGAAAG